MASNWCNPEKWYEDGLLLVPSKRIPTDGVTDVYVLNNENYNFKIAEATCFTEIPYMECNNLYIKAEYDRSSPEIFTAQNIKAKNVVVDGPIKLKSWKDDEYCNYDVKSIVLQKGASAESIICNVDNFIVSGEYSSPGDIYKNIITTKNLYIKLPNPFFGRGIDQCKIKTISGNIISTYNIQNSIIEAKTLHFSGGGSTTVFGPKSTGIGDFFFDTNSINYGTINGNAFFRSNATWNYGIVVGNAIFSGANCINFGTISGNCTFIDSAQNYGKIYGDTNFINAENYGIVSSGFTTTFKHKENTPVLAINFGHISGSAYFNNAINSGQLFGDALFTNRSINYSNISNKNNIIFEKSINSGNISDTNGFQRKSSITSDDNKKPIGGRFHLVDYNFDDGCNVLFSGLSVNYTNINTNGNVLFDSSFNYGFITTQNLKFDNLSFNYSGVVCKNVTFNNRSQNNGTIAALVTKYIFETRMQNYNDLGETSFVDDTPEMLYTDFPYFYNDDYSQPETPFPSQTPTVPFIRDNDSFEYKTIPHEAKLAWFRSNIDSFNCEFNGSINNGIVIKASFLDTNRTIKLQDDSTIIENCPAFNSQNGLINGQAFFNKNSSNLGSVFSGGFYNNSCNSSYVITGVNQASFYNQSTNSGGTSGCIFARFYNNALNFGYTKYAEYYNTSQNYGIGDDAYFYDKSRNGTLLVFDANNNLLGGYGYPQNPVLNGAGTFSDSSINGHYYAAVDKVINPVLSLGAVFRDNSINYGSGNNFSFFNNSSNDGFCTDADFHGKSKNKKHIIHRGFFYDDSYCDTKGSGLNCYFYDQSYNQGYITSTGVFRNNSQNRNPGLISNAIFFDYSTNKGDFNDFNRSLILDRGIISSPTQQPHVIFSGYSTNYGNITDSIIEFGDNAANRGTITWNSKLLFTSSGIFHTIIDVSGTKNYFHFSGPSGTYDTDTIEFLREFYNCRVSSSYFWPQITFNDHSQNYGNLLGYYSYVFNNRSANYGSLSTYPVIPNLHNIAFFSGVSKQSGCSNFGDITNGKAYFINTINSGTVLFPYFEDSINYGNIVGTPTASYYPYRCSSFLMGVSGVQFIDSTNFGQSKLYASFTNSINFGNIFSSGFFIESKNFGFIANDATFIDSYSNGDIGGNLNMTNSTCISSNIRGEANFNNSAYYSKTFLNSLFNYPYYYERIPEDNNWIPDTSGVREFIGAANLRFDGETIFQNANFTNSNNFGGHLMKSAYFQNGINFGDIEGFSHFVNSSVNAYNSTLRGISIFEDSTNYGILNAKNFDTNINGFPNMYYNKYIIDSGILINYPQLSKFISSNKIGSILENSTNRGTVNTPSIFIGSTNYYYTSQPTTFIYSNNNKNNNALYGYNEAVSYIPPYPLYSPPVYIYTYDPPSTGVYSRPHIIQAGYGLINNDSIFINSENNASVMNVIFYNSYNNGIVQGEATLNYSTNDYAGSIIGPNTIFNYSTNHNVVSGNAVFISGSNGSNGLITGDAIFASGSCNSVFGRVLGQITNDGTMTTDC